MELASGVAAEAQTPSIVMSAPRVISGLRRLILVSFRMCAIVVSCYVKISEIKMDFYDFWIRDNSDIFTIIVIWTLVYNTWGLKWNFIL